MAGDSSTAGGISFEIRAEFENLATGLVQVQQKFDAFSKNIQTGSQQIGKAGAAVSEAFERIDQASNRGSAGILRATTRLIGVQIAIQSLISGSGNVGALKELLQGLSNGFSTAAAAIHVSRGALSLWGAGILGAGVAAISFFTRKIEESIKATDDLTASEVKMLSVLGSYKNSLTDANEKADAFRHTVGERLTEALHLSEAAFSANQKRLREIPEEMAAIRQKISAAEGDILGGALDKVLGTDRIKTFNDQLEVLRTELTRIPNEQRAIADKFPWEKANAAIVSMAENAQKLREKLSDIRAEGGEAFDLGIETPAERATKNLQEAKKVVEQLLADNQAIIRLSEGPGLSDTQRQQILSRQHSDTDLGEAAGQVMAAQRNLDVIKLNEETAKQSIKAIEGAQKESDRRSADYARGLSHSIGDAVSMGILQGQNAMQILTGVGQNLFSNMLNEITKNFELGMIGAFKSIGGAGGEVLGAALTGVLGVVGGIFSHKHGGTQSFANIQSGITSSQAVRGIVAGPTSVSIAAVSEDLQRATQPVVTELQGIARILRSIASKSGGSGAGGGLPWPVIPTA